MCVQVGAIRCARRRSPLILLLLLLHPPTPSFVLCHVSVSLARQTAGHVQLCICKCMFCPSAVPKAGAWLLTDRLETMMSCRNLTQRAKHIDPCTQSLDGKTLRKRRQLFIIDLRIVHKDSTRSIKPIWKMSPHMPLREPTHQ